MHFLLAVLPFSLHGVLMLFLLCAILKDDHIIFSHLRLAAKLEAA